MTQSIDLARLRAYVELYESPEIELRFGAFQGRTFRPGVTRQTFSRLKDWALSSFDASYEHTIDELEGGIRRTTVLDDDGEQVRAFTIQKKRIENIDLRNTFVRISVSTETPSESTLLNPTTREKRRWSFAIAPGYRLDLTDVNHETFEVEIELLDDRELPALPALFRKFLSQYLFSPILYTAEERQDVLTKINRALGSQRRQSSRLDLGALMQARDLKMRDLVSGAILPEKDQYVTYTVTIKADGTRMLLFIVSSGVYLVSPPDQIMKIMGADVAQRLDEIGGTVIEGEFIPRSSLSDTAPSAYRRLDVYFLMYDLLSLSGNPDIQYRPLQVRLESVDRYAQAMAPLAYDGNKIRKIRPMLFATKEFVPFSVRKEFYSATRTVLDETYPFKTDGMMFTPAGRYDPSVSRLSLGERRLPTVPDLLKWKPQDQLTIDLESKGGQLFSYVSSRWSTKRIRSIDSAYRDQLSSIGDGRFVFAGSSMHPFEPASMLRRNDVLDNAPDGAVVEFQWRHGKLEAARVRTDKAVPNAIDVAVDVWGDIFSPITRDVITGRSFGLSFRYHSREKWAIYNYVGRALPESKTRSLLSIGAGRGGDVFKWVRNKFTHVVCVEPDEDNRIELVRRLQDTKLKYRVLATTGQDIDPITQAVRDFVPGGTVDMIGYMLSLSFFFDTRESAASIQALARRVLAKDGYWCAFTIDGKRAREFFQTPALATTINDVSRARFKQIDFELRPPTDDVPVEHVYVDIPDSIVRHQTEFLVDLDAIGRDLEAMDADMVAKTPATAERLMTTEERHYSSLFVSVIYRRNSGVAVTAMSYADAASLIEDGDVESVEIAKNQYGVYDGNTRLRIKANGQTSTVKVRYDKNTNEIFPPLVPFDTIESLIDERKIVGVEAEQERDDGTTIMEFTDQQGNVMSAVARYDAETNEIFPPE